MELQNKFEEIIKDNSSIGYSWTGMNEEHRNFTLNDNTFLNITKECTKLCLEEQIKFLNDIIEKRTEFPFLFIECAVNKLQTQLKELENESK
jgi:hypothetical protein